MRDAIDNLGRLTKGSAAGGGGWGSIPNGKRGGQRKRVGSKYQYRYPDGSGGWKSGAGGKSKAKAKAKGGSKGVKQTIQLSVRPGAEKHGSGEVEAMVHGVFAAHKAAGSTGLHKYNVTHVPTGLSVKGVRTQREARTLAKLLAEKVGDVMTDLKTGETPDTAKNASHKAAFDKIRTAMEEHRVGQEEEQRGKIATRVAKNAEKAKEAKFEYSKVQYKAGSDFARAGAALDEKGEHTEAARKYARGADLMTFAARAAEEAGDHPSWAALGRRLGAAGTGGH